MKEFCRNKQHIKPILELIVSYGLRAVQLLLFWLPVKKNRIMVYCHDRKGFACSPKYIVLELKERYGEDLEIIWATMYPETCEEVEQLGIRVIKNNRLLQAWLYLRTRFFVTNDAFPSWALHRKNQIWLNTWHGAMNYKNIGYDTLEPMSSVAFRLYRISNRQPDYYLAGSRFFAQDTAKSFRFDETVFLPTGLPRNDVFFRDRQEIREKVLAHYHADSSARLALFAPTFRKSKEADAFGIDVQAVCCALSKRFGGEWILLFRNHNFIKGTKEHSGIMDVSAYHDMQELLCASDVLISDYSSCLYDFCMTKRPAFVYATDLENYIHNDRSFAYPIEKWPYPIAQNNAELVTQILNFDQNSFAARVAAHLQDVGAYDNGTASAQVAKIVKKHCL